MAIGEAAVPPPGAPPPGAIEWSFSEDGRTEYALRYVGRIGTSVRYLTVIIKHCARLTETNQNVSNTTFKYQYQYHPNLTKKNSNTGMIPGNGKHCWARVPGFRRRG
jgi:hypothetical protein